MVGVDKTQVDTRTVGGRNDLSGAARHPHHHCVEEPVVDDLVAASRKPTATATA